MTRPFVPRHYPTRWLGTVSAGHIPEAVCIWEAQVCKNLGLVILFQYYELSRLPHWAVQVPLGVLRTAAPRGRTQERGSALPKPAAYGLVCLHYFAGRAAGMRCLRRYGESSSDAGASTSTEAVIRRREPSHVAVPPAAPTGRGGRNLPEEDGRQVRGRLAVPVPCFTDENRQGGRPVLSRSSTTWSAPSKTAM